MREVLGLGNRCLVWEFRGVPTRWGRDKCVCELDGLDAGEEVDLPELSAPALSELLDQGGEIKHLQSGCWRGVRPAEMNPIGAGINRLVGCSRM